MSNRGAENAAKLGCHQILWLFGEDHQITEVGAMNIFFVIKNKNGKCLRLKRDVLHLAGAKLKGNT
jgi:branched-subunit amino acid aminotransferase/4-amino-4-deoxychorismate lyase